MKNKKLKYTAKGFIRTNGNLSLANIYFYDENHIYLHIEPFKIPLKAFKLAKQGKLNILTLSEKKLKDYIKYKQNKCL